MSKGKVAICETCGGLLPAVPIGIYQPGEIRLFCSAACKASRSDTPAVKPKRIRKPARTPGEIKKAMRPSETAVKKTIQDDLDRRGVYNLRLNSGRIQTINRSWIQLCKTGTPDNFFLDGVPVFIEVKKEGEKASGEQIENHDRIRQAGGLCFLVDNFDDYTFIISELKSFKFYTEKIKTIVRDIQSGIDFKRT